MELVSVHFVELVQRVFVTIFIACFATIKLKQVAKIFTKSNQLELLSEVLISCLM